MSVREVSRNKYSTLREEERYFLNILEPFSGPGQMAPEISGLFLSEERAVLLFREGPDGSSSDKRFHTWKTRFYKSCFRKGISPSTSDILLRTSVP